MTRRVGMVLAALLLSGQAVFAADEPRKDLQIFNDVAKSVTRYAQFTIFDDINADVTNGVVTLTGKVTMPYKKNDIVKRVGKIDGVTQVIDKVEVLPVSQFDSELRYRIARAIYGNSNFWQLAVGPNPPIHIVVERGRVTLTGVVPSEVDRMLARTLATGFGEFSVKNELKTDAEMKDALEKS